MRDELIKADLPSANPVCPKEDVDDRYDWIVVRRECLYVVEPEKKGFVWTSSADSGESIFHVRRLKRHQEGSGAKRQRHSDDNDDDNDYQNLTGTPPPSENDDSENDDDDVDDDDVHHFG
jgi:hypothetical protein